jgi:DNA-binding response OmpR family regulator
VPEDQQTLPSADGPAIVIAVAPTAADRVRIAAAVGGAAPVLIVGSVREAVLLLLRDVSLAEEPKACPTQRLEPAPHDLEIDSDARVVTCGDRQADLSPLEHDLLVSLHEAGGHIRTFAWLQRHVWHNDHQGSRSHVQSTVKRLRRKLADVDSPVQVDGVRGVGLRLVSVRSARHLG